MPAPPALLMNSAPYTATVPHGAVRFDAEAARLYASANRVRTEPKPAPLLTEADLLRQEGWTKAQLTAARAAGFPAPTAAVTFTTPTGFRRQRTPVASGSRSTVGRSCPIAPRRRALNSKAEGLCGAIVRRARQWSDARGPCVACPAADSSRQPLAPSPCCGEAVVETRRAQKFVSGPAGARSPFA